MAIVDLTVKLAGLLERRGYADELDFVEDADELLPELLEELMKIKVVEDLAYDPQTKTIVNINATYRPAVDVIYQMVYFDQS